MKVIRMLPLTDSFAENKEVARQLRVEVLEPALADGKEVQLDFLGVTGATQSFVHALLSEIMRANGADVLDRLSFANCNPPTRKVIQIVTDYMQQSGAAE